LRGWFEGRFWSIFFPGFFGVFSDWLQKSSSKMSLKVFNPAQKHPSSFLTLSYQFFHTLKISKANSSIIERQKMMKLFFCHSLDCFFLWTSSDWELNNFIAISGFQALCVSNVSHLDFFFFFFSCRRKKFKIWTGNWFIASENDGKAFVVFLIERPITLFYWIQLARKSFFFSVSENDWFGAIEWFDLEKD
jgi:hypothetical protein